MTSPPLFRLARERRGLLPAAMLLPLPVLAAGALLPWTDAATLLARAPEIIPGPLGPAALALSGLLLVRLRRAQQRLAGTIRELEEGVRLRTAALAESEARLRSVVETAADGILVADGAGRIVSVNAAALRLFGHASAEELIGRDLGLLLPGAGLDLAQDGATLGRELMARRRDGGEFPVELSLAGFTSGGARFLTAVLRDVGERRRAEERQRLLAREVDHRARNALTMVQAAVRLTPKADPVEFARVIEGRVLALARAQTLLAETRWEGVTLVDLARGELAPFLPEPGTGEGPARLDGPAVTLAAAAAQPIAMVLHELATNAVKYGALSTREGRIALSWAVETAAGQLRLRWQEAGGPPLLAPPLQRGFGSRMLAATIRDQLGGRLTRSWTADGLVCEITLPLARVLAE